MKKLIPRKLKNIWHFLVAVAANFRYGFPTKKLKVIGVTGTDGKTTTCQMISGILEEAGKKVALASTINFRINGKEEKNLSHFTTMSPFAVQKFAKRAVGAGCEFLIMETSSHSLDQYRVWGVDYETAVITNVTREHLDYHETMEKYRAAKKILFKKAKNIIVNLDMKKPEYYLDVNAKNKCGYSIINQELEVKNKNEIKIIKGKDLKLGIDKSKFKINNTEFELYLPGDFNVENALAAVCVGNIYGIGEDIMARALAKIKGVPGRMEYVVNNKNLNILVDFALTPNALEKLYSVLVKIKNSQANIIAVFGACGERDRGKRPIIGEIVSKYADYVIVTNDEPYGEDPMQIINEISIGIKNKEKDKNFWIIPDRRKAIAKALQVAKANDIIAVTGMGAEESMVINGKKIPWNDKQVILEELEK